MQGKATIGHCFLAFLVMLIPWTWAGRCPSAEGLSVSPASSLDQSAEKAAGVSEKQPVVLMTD